jgi:DNA-binding response OmpR family regulator
MPSAPAEDEAAPSPLHGSVLYIEDVDLNYLVVEAILSRHPGVTLRRAATGAEGVRHVRGEHPDFVLLDMHLPDMSGLDVIRLLSETIAERQLRVTILTGDKLTTDVIKAMSLGAYEYMVKPVNVALLEAGLRRALSGKRASRAHTLQGPR